MKIKLNNVILDEVYNYEVSKNTITIRFDLDSNISENQMKELKKIDDKLLFVRYNDSKAIYIGNVNISNINIKHIE